VLCVAFSAFALMVGEQQVHLACKKTVSLILKGSIAERAKEEN